MHRTIYLLVLILAMNNCIRENNVDGRKNLNTDSLFVLAKKRIYHEDGRITYTDWLQFPTRTINHLPGYRFPRRSMKLNKFGGRTDRRTELTGFYHVRKIDGRWWVVDPEGCLFKHVAVNSLYTGRSQRNRDAMDNNFGSKETWINETNKMLHRYGFNGTGSRSDIETIIASKQQTVTPLAYTVNLNFMSGYGKLRGGIYTLGGQTVYPNNTIFVFDKNFEHYCDEVARQLIKYSNDPNLFGYFTDNELPFTEKTLDGYITLGNHSDPGYIAATDWLCEHGIKEDEISDECRMEFQAYVTESYLKITTEAIRKYDPNHMVLGSRLHGDEKSSKNFLTTAGQYVDVLSCIYYGKWTPDPVEINNWTLWSGRPYIISEWYIKGEDTGLPNQAGAGWIVKTQRDRGLFYQNFTLALLESNNCVGWHWFKYMDNDPTSEGAELSNFDANKGIVDNYYKEYKSCLEIMSEINMQIYELSDYFDNQ
jgi:hypothetical protein